MRLLITKKRCLFGIFVACTIYFYICSDWKVPGWEQGISRNTSAYISIRKTANILPDNFCTTKSLLLIIVASAPGNAIARQAIRQSWGNQTTSLGDNASLYFLLGQTFNTSLQLEIDEEAKNFSDIVQEAFVDSYYNLTLKTVSMLKLASQYCNNSATKYLMKTDDDMFVNVNVLLDNLQARSQSNNTLMGRVTCNTKPIKDITSKWYSPSYMYSDEYYPDYLSGTGYVMSLDVSRSLFSIAMETPLIHLEDVFLTGICATKANIRREHNNLFTFHRLEYDPCLISNLITSHLYEPDQLISTYIDLQNLNNCPNANVVDMLTANIRLTNYLYTYKDCDKVERKQTDFTFL